MVHPSVPFDTDFHMKNVSPSIDVIVSVAIARYRPRSRTAMAPAISEIGTVAAAASGMASQNGHPHDCMAMPVVMAPMPANVYGISEISPEDAVRTVTYR